MSTSTWCLTPQLWCSAAAHWPAAGWAEKEHIVLYQQTLPPQKVTNCDLLINETRSEFIQQRTPTVTEDSVSVSVTQQHPSMTLNLKRHTRYTGTPICRETLFIDVAAVQSNSKNPVSERASERAGNYVIRSHLIQQKLNNVTERWGHVEILSCLSLIFWSDSSVFFSAFRSLCLHVWLMWIQQHFWFSQNKSEIIKPKPRGTDRWYLYSHRFVFSACCSL